MSESARRFLIALLLWLGTGILIGWIYDRPATGLLIAALLALAWQVRQLLAFDRAIHKSNFDAFRFGEGLWQQISSRFQYEHARGNRYREQHRRLLRELRKSTNAMPDGAVILNDENEIEYCNRAAKALVGIRRKKDRGQRVDNILRDPDLVALLHDGDADRTVDIASPVKDGCWLSCRVVPYGAAQKMLLLRDVTESTRLRKMRRDFIANASHELRSPLTVISGYLDAIAEDSKVSSAWEQPIGQMQSQARRMAQLISELMELSRLEASGQAGTDDVVDVAGLLAAARKAYQGQHDVPSINLEVSSDAHLLGDSREIESVITNLLSNAIRHTPSDGGITLAWDSRDDGATLVVSDTGEGIDEEHIPRLTERFFRVDRGRARDDGGIGLGLAIVKHVLTRHEADLEINAKPGEGSTFSCHFPKNRVVSAPLS
jgi:two-component system phosphate regulon sensor histidine kinase PhoR